jgi:para-nitrobenzyl esterase
MRLSSLAFSAALLLAPAVASAQSQPAPAAASHYSTGATKIGQFLDDPAAKAVVEKHLPGMLSNDQIEMARDMTLKDLQQYAPDNVTDKALADLDADLAKIPAKQ